jgi:hypothetical protein
MAHVTQTPVRAFAHCPDPRCPGNAQEPVDGLLRHTDVLYTDTDPNGIPGIEKSYNSVTFADEDVAPCPHCETYREISQQKRPVYENRSKQNPLELLRVQDREHGLQVPAPAPPAVAAVDPAVVEQMMAKIADLEHQLDGKANKPGPKPKAE